MAPNRPLYPLVALLTGVALAMAAFWFVWTLLLWYRLHPHLPVRDLFVILNDILPLLGSETDWTGWKVLIEPHYAAHRIAIPRLLVALDLSFFRGQNHVLYASAWLGIFTCIGIYMGMARDYFRQNRTSWLFCLGMVSILFFAPAHLWNLINAINASWHITFACAFIAFAVLLRAPGNPNPGAWATAYGFATIAAFTTFAGVIVWLLLPVFAFGHSKRTVALTAGLSVLLTLTYLNGISSDAEIAATWQGKNSAAVSQMQKIGLEAMEGNTPAVILHKAMKFLAWPMPLAHPTAGLILVGLSFILLTYFWLRFLLPQKSDQDYDHPWLKFSLLIATLGLGIALATQLGRVVEQANYADGPSFERYSTVVAVYWSGIFGLLLSFQARLADRYRISLMLGSMALVTALIVPGGNYLKQEILSVEHAAKLYAGGETAELRGKIDKKLLRFKPEYVYSFDAFFSKNGLAYKTQAVLPYQPNTPANCEDGLFDTTASRPHRKGYKNIEGHLSSPLSSISRNILIFEDNKLAARLYPRHRGDYSPLALLNPEYNTWLGHIRSNASRADQLQVIVNSLDPKSFRCKMGSDSNNLPNRHAGPKAPQNV